MPSILQQKVVYHARNTCVQLSINIRVRLDFCFDFEEPHPASGRKDFLKNRVGWSNSPSPTRHQHLFLKRKWCEHVGEFHIISSKSLSNPHNQNISVGGLRNNYLPLEWIVKLWPVTAVVSQATQCYPDVSPQVSIFMPAAQLICAKFCFCAVRFVCLYVCVFQLHLQGVHPTLFRWVYLFSEANVPGLKKKPTKPFGFPPPPPPPSSPHPTNAIQCIFIKMLLLPWRMSLVKKQNRLAQTLDT